MIKRILDVFLFSSFFIAVCAVMMSWQAMDLFEQPVSSDYLWFVFFSTIYSYNLHWYFTIAELSASTRLSWLLNPKILHVILIVVGLTGSFFFFLRLIDHVGWILLAGVLTFLYTAPKLPFPASKILRRMAIGKTIFLSFVWTYVTSVLPILLSGVSGTNSIIFCCSRFFLIYAICILFDYRDREQDRKEGIRSMITFFDAKGITALYMLSVSLFALFTIGLFFVGFSILTVGLLLMPGIILLILYPYAKKHHSDYMYYLVLDGLMMMSSLFTWIEQDYIRSIRK